MRNASKADASKADMLKADASKADIPKHPKSETPVPAMIKPVPKTPPRSTSVQTSLPSSPDSAFSRKKEPLTFDASTLPKPTNSMASSILSTIVTMSGMCSDVPTLLSKLIESANVFGSHVESSASTATSAAAFAAAGAGESDSDFVRTKRRRVGPPSFASEAAPSAGFGSFYDPEDYSIENEIELNDALIAHYMSPTWMANQSFNMSTVNKNRTENPALAREQYLYVISKRIN